MTQLSYDQKWNVFFVVVLVSLVAKIVFQFVGGVSTPPEFLAVGLTIAFTAYYALALYWLWRQTQEKDSSTAARKENITKQRQLLLYLTYVLLLIVLVPYAFRNLMQ